MLKKHSKYLTRKVCHNYFKNAIDSYNKLIHIDNLTVWTQLKLTILKLMIMKGLRNLNY